MTENNNYEGIIISAAVAADISNSYSSQSTGRNTEIRLKCCIQAKIEKT